MLCGLLSTAWGDEILFAVAYSRFGIHYPEWEILDWAKGKAMHLTPGGMRQHYLLGRELRQRYIDDLGLLSDRYGNRDQLLVTSVASKAAVTSAYAQLAGLYLPGTGDLLQNSVQRDNAVPPNQYDYTAWKEELESAALNYTYQAIPITENGGVPDTLLNAEEACPGVVARLQNAFASKMDKHDALKPEFKILTDAFKLQPDEVRDVDKANRLRDALICSLAEGQPVVPEEDAYRKITETLNVEVVRDYDFFSEVVHSDNSVSKIAATPLLRTIQDYFETAKKNRLQNNTSKNPLRLALYVGSGKLAIAALRQLKVLSDNERTDASFASLMLLELYKNSSLNMQDNTDFYVRVTFNKHVQNLVIPYPDFLTKLNEGKYSDGDFKSLCASWNPKEDSSSFNWVIFGIVGGAIVGVVLIVFLIICIRMRCHGSEDSPEKEEEVLKALKGQLGVKDTSSA